MAPNTNSQLPTHRKGNGVGIGKDLKQLISSFEAKWNEMECSVMPKIKRKSAPTSNLCWMVSSVEWSVEWSNDE